MSLKRKHSALHGTQKSIAVKHAKVHAKSKSADTTTQTSSIATQTNVRDLLSSLRTGVLSNATITSRLQVLETVFFPKKDEWILNYLLWTLGRQKVDSNEDVERIWQTIAIICDDLPTERSKIVLRKFDLAQLVLDNLRYSVANPLCHAVIHVNSVIQHLATERKMKKLFLTSIETSVATLMASLELCSLSPSVPQALVESLVDLLVYNRARRSTSRKLEVTIHSYGLEPLVHYFATSYDTRGVHTLLNVSLFSEAGLDNLEVLRVSISKCCKEVGIEQFCRASFRSLQEQAKNSSQALKARNTLLKIWLEASDLSAPALQIYKDTQVDTKITRPLSSDETLSSVLKSVITRALLEESSTNTEVLITLLDIDLDTLFPAYEDRMWSYVANSQDAILLAHWLRAYIKVRALIPGLQILLRTTTTIEPELLDEPLVNLLASELAKNAVAVQQNFLDDLLASKSHLRTELLIALIGGLPRASPVLQGRLHTLEEVGRKSAQLSRLIGFKADPSILSLNSGGSPPQDASSAEFWLRRIELGSENDVSEITVKAVDHIIELVKQDSGFREVVVQRWLPTLTPLMTLEQKKQFIDSLNIRGSTEPELLTDANLLECDALHDVLQTKLVSLLHTNNWPVLLQIPIEFLHRAVRKSITAQLTSPGLDVNVRTQLLLKFVQSGLMTPFETIDAFIEFATLTIAASGSNTDSSPSSTLCMDKEEVTHDERKNSDSLRHKLIASLPQKVCEEILNKVDCPSLLKLEILDQHEFPATILTKVRAELITGILDELFESSTSADDCHASLKLLLGLVRHEYRNKAIPTEATFKDLVANYHKDRDTLEELQRLILKSADSRSVVLLAEILAYQCNSAAEAIRLIQNHRSPREVEQILAALTVALPITELISTISMWQTSTIDDEEDGTSIAWRLFFMLICSKSRSPEIDGFWLSDQLTSISRTCLKSTASDTRHMALEIALQVIQNHGRCVTIVNIDYLCLLVCALLKENDNFNSNHVLLAHKLLRAVFLHHANLLRDRYQVIVNLFQQLLTAALSSAYISKDSVESLTRLFETFLSSSRSLSSLPEQFNKAIAKHVPWLLIQYIHIITNPAAGRTIPVEAKKILEEGLVYEIMSLCGSHEREMIGVSLDSAGRGIFKRLYDDWTRFGKWSEH